MSYPDPSGTARRDAPPGGLDALRRSLRTALLGGLALALGLAVVGSVVGWFVAEGKGVAGALTGAALAAGFLAVTLLTGVLTTRMSTNATVGILMGGWLLKMVGFIVVLALLRGADFYHPGVLFGTLVAAVVGTLLLDGVVVQRSRIPYLEPDRAL